MPRLKRQSYPESQCCLCRVRISKYVARVYKNLCTNCEETEREFQEMDAESIGQKD